MVNTPSFSFLSVKQPSSHPYDLIVFPSCMKGIHFPVYAVISLYPGNVFISLALERRLKSML